MPYACTPTATPPTSCKLHSATCRAHLQDNQSAHVPPLATNKLVQVVARTRDVVKIMNDYANAVR
jgi:hypothetical protein